ncbi:MAG: DUF4175 family protein [Pirellulaceae bacterium]|nr:DUF4175 family protein [Pirellulaceae bacterium]
MPHPLETRVESIRRQAIGLVRARGLGLLVAVVVFLLMIFGLLDFALRLHDPGSRWILSGCLLAAIIWTTLRLVVPAFRYRLSRVQAAQHIERVHPQLASRLSSVMDFLIQGEADPTAGSADLRRAVVAETDSLATDLDFRRAIDSRSFVRAMLAALAALLLAGVLVLLDRNAAGLAIARLAMPWSELAWPRRNQLEFVRELDKIAVGDDFEVELIDRHGRLPDRVQIQLRHLTPTGTRTETRPMQPLADRMVFRFDNVTRPFAYRARGGDDDTMPWIELAVVEPPRVLSLDLTIQPPAYTALPRESAGRVARAIAGSSLSLAGRVDKPITSAKLQSEIANLALPAVQITPAGRGFVVPAGDEPPWVVARSLAFWLELTDASGLPTGRDSRVEIQVVPDTPPSIAWEAPADHSFVTTRALVAIRALVKDDLAIRNVQLRYLRPGGSDQEVTVELFAGPPVARPPSAMGDGESRPIEFTWDVGELAGLAAGDVLAIRLTAEDYQPQLATTVARRLTIITPEELEQRLGQRQTSILGQLAEALRMQRECRQQLAELLIRLEETGTLDASDLNHLQSAQLNQRQIENLLGAGPEGVEGQIVALQAELAANRIEGEAISQRMSELLGQVRRLNREPVVAIGQRLTEAFKLIREQAGCGEPGVVGDSLRAAAERQDEVIQSLEGLLGSLTEWDNFSRLAREIGQIRLDQQKLADDTELLRLRAAVTTGSLPPEDRAAARQLAQRELELARRLDKIQGRMEELLGRLTASDPASAATLADALAAARRLAIGGQMRSAADLLAKQQFGSSHQAQGNALDGLKQLLDLLSSRREDELARTAKSLRAAAGELAGLAARHAATQAELDAAAAAPQTAENKRRLERLTKELAQLAEEIEQLGRKLQRLTATKAAAATTAAGQQAAAAGQAAGEGQADQAQAQSQQAGSRLEEARRELVQAIAQAEQELAEQQLARLEQWLAGLVARQKNVVREIARLETARQASGGDLAPAERLSLRGVASEQRLLGDETEQLRQKLAEMAAFAFALEGAGQEMSQAAAVLARGETGASAQTPAAAALARMEQILTALAGDESGSTEPPADQNPPQPGGESPGGDQANSLAELKLLQLLQQAIQRRTAELEATRVKQGELTAEQARELDQLATEQGRLADMVLELIRSAATRPEDDPASLPEPTRPPAPSPPGKKPSLDEELLNGLEK